MDRVMGGIYLGGPGVDSLHCILDLLSSSYHTMNYTVYHSHLLISLALCETPCVSVQLRGSSQPGSIIPSHPLPTLLEPEPLNLTKSFWNAVRGVAEY